MTVTRHKSRHNQSGLKTAKVEKPLQHSDNINRRKIPPLAC